MTYAEARQLLRKVYDQWDAVRKLHEILEKAAEAENYLSSAQTQVDQAKAQVEVLQGRLQSDSVLRDELYARWAAEDKARAEKVHKELEIIKQATQEVRAAHEAEKKRLASDLETAQDSHKAALVAMQKEAGEARSATDEIINELTRAKNQLAKLLS